MGEYPDKKIPPKDTVIQEKKPFLKRKTFLKPLKKNIINGRNHKFEKADTDNKNENTVIPQDQFNMTMPSQDIDRSLSPHPFLRRKSKNPKAGRIIKGKVERKIDCWNKAAQVPHDKKKEVVLAHSRSNKLVDLHFIKEYN